jgi:hypothetical protein
MCVSPASPVSAHDESGADAVNNKCGISTACGEPGMDGVHTCTNHTPRAETGV